MELLNDTAWEARLFTGAIDDRQMGAWLVARATFAVDSARGRLIPTEVRWPIFHEKVATRYGTFPSDNYPMSHGCELLILGSARCRQPVRRTRASFTVGSFSRSLDVIGDRRWVRTAEGALVPSEPESFTAMSLDWARAYGGRSETHGEPTAFGLNPDGKGICLSEETSEGTALPNLEDPAEPIRHWNDAPTPAAWGPVPRSTPWQIRERLRGRQDAPSDEEFAALAKTVTPCASVPRNTPPAVRGDEEVAIELGDDRAAFSLPGWNLKVDVQVGAERSRQRTSVSGLWFLADTQLLVVTFRSRWRYPLRPRETRSAMLRALAA